MPTEPTLRVEVKQTAIEKPPRRGIVEFLASAGGAALVTVVLGGTAGQLISCDVQRRAQEREFTNSWLRSRGDQALVARKEFLDGRRAALHEILTTVGAIANASDELIYITQPSFSTKGLSESNRQNFVAEQTKIHAAFRAAELAWAPSQPRFAFDVSYFSDGDVKVSQTWRDLTVAVNNLRTCASDVYSGWQMAGRGLATFVYRPLLCKSQFEAVMTNVEQLGRVFAQTTDRPWDGWENPDELRRKLRIE